VSTYTDPDPDHTRNGSTRSTRLSRPRAQSERAGSSSASSPVPGPRGFVSTGASRPITATRSDPSPNRPFRRTRRSRPGSATSLRWNAAVDGGPGQPPGRRHRRASRHLRLGGDALRGGVQPLLPAKSAEHPGDQVFFQGHSAPGIYTRAFLEGRLTEATAGRLSPGGRGGLPSYLTPGAATSGSSRPCRWASA